MLISDTSAALCTLTILFVWLSGNLELWHLYLVNAITGTAQTFQQPASEVATTLVTPEDKYQKAGSLNALAYSVINMASPVDGSEGGIKFPQNKHGYTPGDTLPSRNQLHSLDL